MPIDVPEAYPDGQCEVLLLRADDIVHDDDSAGEGAHRAQGLPRRRSSTTLSLPGQRLMAHVPSHHDHQVGEWIGIRPEVDHVVTFRAGD